MKVLVTGSAGFIGFYVSKKLLKNGHEVVGVDNVNDYYEVSLKFSRLEELGIAKDLASKPNNVINSSIYNHFRFIRMDISEKKDLDALFAKEKFDSVCNLAAQAGVRYSIINPDAYVKSNITGFFNILEACRHHNVKHLVYASSSSVYGLNKKVPFDTSDQIDHPVSLYAATKKSNELMAHTYSHLYNIQTTGLRFFTVYGPWGRPDMAMFLFTKAILEEKPIKIFNHGNMKRDFTYIDDISEGVVRILEDRRDFNSQRPKYRVYNIGNNNSVKLMDFVSEIERCLGKTATKEFLPMQPGDVENTWANVEPLINDYGYRPDTPIKRGVASFVDWYTKYYG